MEVITEEEIKRLSKSCWKGFGKNRRGELSEPIFE
jgi:hypothetical protein